VNIRWTKPTGSGLCDRLYDLLFLATLARVQCARLFVDWQHFDIQPIDMAHRRIDILLENVRAHINFPSEIVFSKDDPCDTIFDYAIGAGASYEDLFAVHGSHLCSHQEFKRVLGEVRKEFTFCAPITSFLTSIPSRFASIHVRRGDKVRTTPHDGRFITVDELDRLNELTYKAIDYLATRFSAFFLCGDEDEKIKPFRSYIEAKGCTTFGLPAMEKWVSTYYDIAVMTKSEFIVTSQRFSTFSLVPSLLGIGQTQTVYEMEEGALYENR
jgi:hypothetical protein